MPQSIIISSRETLTMHPSMLLETLYTDGPLYEINEEGADECVMWYGFAMTPTDIIHY